MTPTPVPAPRETAVREPAVRQHGALVVGTEEDTAGLLLALRARGVEVATVSPADGADAVGAALDGLGDRTPVACGGDGTIHHLVRQLAERDLLDRPVGLVPRGTGDDLAGHLGQPSDPAEAAELLLSGLARAVDVLETDDGALVVNVDHLGLGARAARRAGSWKTLLGPAAYVVGGLAVALHQSEWGVTVEVDGRCVHDGPAVVVAVGVGHRVGGGVELLPGAEADDAVADVLVTAPTPLRQRLSLGRALQRGTHERSPAVTTTRGREVTLRSDRPMPLDTDGELLEPVTSRTWRLRAAAWSVITR